MEQIPFLDLHAMHDELSSDLDACWTQLRTTGQFVGGPAVDDFEAAWAAYCDRRFAVGLANGTDAIELALSALGVGPGDEVVVPANTFIATCEAVTAVGATPVFADVDPERLLMTAETVLPVLTEATRALLPVHLFGHCVDMTEISALAQASDLLVVEDAAQAHGARWQGQVIGSFGDAASFSFYPGKNLGAFGDAGAVVTDDEDVADRIRSLANHGRSLTSHTQHIADGCNSRLDAVHAMVLSVKLSALDRWNDARRLVAGWYREQLPEGVALVPVAEGEVPVHHLAVVRVPNRDKVRVEMAEAKIATGIHYPVACHTQPAFARFSRTSLPVAEQAAAEVLSLPMFPHMTEVQVESVCSSLQKILGGLQTKSSWEVHG